MGADSMTGVCVPSAGVTGVLHACKAFCVWKAVDVRASMLTTLHSTLTRALSRERWRLLAAQPDALDRRDGATKALCVEREAGAQVGLDGDALAVGVTDVEEDRLLGRLGEPVSEGRDRGAGTVW